VPVAIGGAKRAYRRMSTYTASLIHYWYRKQGRGSCTSTWLRSTANCWMVTGTAGLVARTTAGARPTAGCLLVPPIRTRREVMFHLRFGGFGGVPVVVRPSGENFPSPLGQFQSIRPKILQIPTGAKRVITMTSMTTTDDKLRTDGGPSAGAFDIWAVEALPRRYRHCGG